MAKKRLTIDQDFAFCMNVKRLIAVSGDYGDDRVNFLRLEGLRKKVYILATIAFLQVVFLTIQFRSMQNEYQQQQNLVVEREQRERNAVNSIRAEGFLVDARNLMTKLDEQAKLLIRGKQKYPKKEIDQLMADFGSAKRLFYEGKELYSSRKWAVAQTKFEESTRLSEQILELGSPLTLKLESRVEHLFADLEKDRQAQRAAQEQQLKLRKELAFLLKDGKNTIKSAYKVHAKKYAPVTLKKATAMLKKAIDEHYNPNKDLAGGIAIAKAAIATARDAEREARRSKEKEVEQLRKRAALKRAMQSIKKRKKSR